jgi:1,4-dihydroxy-2-naphthoyl-CoA synthase
MMSSETLIYEKEDFEEGSMVTLTMNKPETLNALNIEFSREIDEALTKVEQDDDVKAGIRSLALGKPAENISFRQDHHRPGPRILYRGRIIYVAVL